jgi:hypothetical protein
MASAPLSHRVLAMINHQKSSSLSEVEGAANEVEAIALGASNLDERQK